MGGFPCREETGQRTGYNECNGGLDGDMQIYRGVGKEGLFKHTGIHGLATEIGIHPLCYANAGQHADVAKQGGNDHTLWDNKPM